MERVGQVGRERAGNGSMVKGGKGFGYGVRQGAGSGNNIVWELLEE